MAQWSAISHQNHEVVYLNEEISGNIQVECSPFPSSYDLIALAEAQSVHILRALFDQSSPAGCPLLRDERASCKFDSEVSLLRWGSSGTPSSVNLAVACGNSLYHCSKSIENHRLKQVRVGKHSAMVTDAAFPSHSRSRRMVSVGEDCRLRIWDLERGVESESFHLSSAGTSVRWYDNGNDSLLFVAEDNGVISLRDLRVDGRSGGLPLYQRRSTLPPELVGLANPLTNTFRAENRLQNMDWTESFPDWLGGVANNTWHIWDLKMTSAPVQSGPISTQKPITSFRWGKNPRSPQQPLFFVSGFGQWQMWEVQQGRQLWEVQQDEQQTNRVSGVHWKGESPKMFTGNASLLAGGPSVLVVNYKQLEFTIKS